MPSTHGPIPKRSDEGDRRTIARKQQQPGGITKATAGEHVSIPDPDPDWHPIARMIWDAAHESGQSKFYESSDWAVIYSLCDDLSYYKKMGRRSAQMLASINSMLTSLLFTEGDRRRVQIELDRKTDEELKSAGVALMEDFARQRKIGK